MDDPRLQDHATGVELQIVELVEKAERARVQGQEAEAKAYMDEIARLQDELAATAETLAAPPATEPDIHAEHADTTA